jgi:hypothetical protein
MPHKDVANTQITRNQLDHKILNQQSEETVLVIAYVEPICIY